jgi:hypothetical protein
MDVLRHWRRLAAPRPGAGKKEEVVAAPSQQMLHQQRLGRMLKKGLPARNELPPRCDDCGRRLLTGELATIVRSGDELVLTCRLCEERLAQAGYEVLRAGTRVA